MGTSTMSGPIANASPNKLRVRQLSDRLGVLQEELEGEKQARNDAVELKLRVLDDKPLHEQISKLQEELAAERLSREVMDERKSKEIKAVEQACQLDLTVEKRGRKDLENKIMKQVDETCFALRLDLAREKKL